jgi:hypothetical protein
LLQLIRRAASRAACTAGSSKPTSTPMIAMTTSNSTRVNPFFVVLIKHIPNTKKEKEERTSLGCFQLPVESTKRKKNKKQFVDPS